MYFYLSATKSHREFKEAAGQANHYLVTLELSLDALATHGARKDCYFYPMWNPRNASRSIVRSEEFLLGASLSWAVDSIDGYFSSLVRSSRLIAPGLRVQVLENSRSIQRKVDVVAEAYDLQADYRTALVHLLIQWRNNLTHLGAKNTLRPQMRQLIHKNTEQIYDRHRKLDVGFMLSKFDKGEYPEFRDATSLLRGTKLFLDEVDQKIVRAIHVRRFLLASAKQYFEASRQMQKLGNALSADDLRKKNYSTQVLKELGLSMSEEKPELGSHAFISIAEIFSLFESREKAKRIVR